MDQVEEIKRKIDIVEVIGEHVPLKRAGKNFRGLCPFHTEKTPSFMVSPELQIFKCFGCGAGGDAYRFLMEFEKVDFPQALKVLADRAGIKLKPLRGFPEYEDKEEIYRVNYLLAELYHHILVSHRLGVGALEYLVGERGIKKDSIETFRLGFAPDSADFVFRFLTVKRGYKPQLLEKAGIVVRRESGYFDRFRGRIIFPLRDQFGNVLGFSGRVLKERGDVAKYINTPETLVYKKGRLLYGLEVAKKEIKEKELVVVVEGEIDAISAWQGDLRNVVAVKGSALTEDQARLIMRFCPTIVLALDTDSAGLEAARRAAEVAEKAGLEARVAQLGGFKDPDEMAQKDPEALKKAVLGAVGVYDFLIDLIFSRFDPGTPEGKGRISRLIAPVLSKISDEILKAHYVKQVAGRLGVREEAVLAQVAKQKTAAPKIEAAFQIPSRAKNRRDLLEEYLLALLFQTTPGLVGDIEPFVKTPAAKRIVEEFGKLQKSSPEFDPSRFASELSPELVELFASFVLRDIERVVASGGAEVEIKRTRRELGILDIKQDMNEIAEKIRELEKAGEAKEVNLLEVELREAGNKLAKLEAGL